MKPVLPARIEDVNEGSTCYLPLTHLNSSKALEAPSALSYRIDDITNNRQILDWTSVSTPGSTNTLTITAAQNAIYTRTRKTELRQVTVKTTDSSAGINQTPFYYNLIRIFDNQDWVS